jgi:transcriptional regulator with XRE-family HTH domain
MLDMSQTTLGDRVGVSFQQVQKYENGANRIGASRLQQMSHILQVPVAFFFEGAPNASAPRGSHRRELSIAQIDDFVSDSGGLKLIGAFMRIGNADLRRKIVIFAQEIAVTSARGGKESAAAKDEGEEESQEAEDEAKMTKASSPDRASTPVLPAFPAAAPPPRICA